MGSSRTSLSPRVLHMSNSSPVSVLLSCFKFLLRVMHICEPSHNLFLSPLAWCLIMTESGLITVPCSKLAWLWKLRLLSCTTDLDRLRIMSILALLALAGTAVASPLLARQESTINTNAAPPNISTLPAQSLFSFWRPRAHILPPSGHTGDRELAGLYMWSLAHPDTIC